MSYTIRWDPHRPRGMRFSTVEITQILIAVAAMTLAFTLAQLGGAYGIQALFAFPSGGQLLALVAQRQ